VSLNGLHTISTKVGVTDARPLPNQKWDTALATLRSHRGGIVLLKFGAVGGAIERPLDNLGLARDIQTVLVRARTETLPGWAFSTLKGIAVCLKWAALKSTYKIGGTPVLAIHRLAKAPVMADVPNPFKKVDALSDVSIKRAAGEYRARSRRRQLQRAQDTRLRKKKGAGAA
jgi:hypothetical protein